MKDCKLKYKNKQHRKAILKRLIELDQEMCDIDGVIYCPEPEYRLYGEIEDKRYITATLDDLYDFSFLNEAMDIHWQFDDPECLNCGKEVKNTELYCSEKCFNLTIL